MPMLAMRIAKAYRFAARAPRMRHAAHPHSYLCRRPCVLPLSLSFASAMLAP
ncbi:hypothetical protein [Xanthomonas translucens]|uniref:Uncharacterized protein n=1 Tax=Xanthomonas translucens pv. translucens DSM 18974 TaxID=1261556 RepID=A0A1C3TJV8_XANCT|nr:hypothetical protein [Xanthomonas translucens]CCP40495.1 hypothetical protein BN444_02218 [Xanthomonas translucens pv. translucens DSM 18974]SCB03522.1 hypothetical protein BN444_02218 [Xanthomonas translucens pv. translucens DSM 18974]